MPSLPPSTFDILPPLHTLLSRLLLPPPQTNTPAPNNNTPSAPSPTSAASPSQTPLTATTYLSPKDLNTAASAVKIKIQKARVAVQGLPDVERTVEELEEEARELEGEVRRLRGVLGGLGEGGRSVSGELGQGGEGVGNE